MMKKLIKLQVFFIIVSLSLVFISCKLDDTEDEDTENMVVTTTNQNNQNNQNNQTNQNNQNKELLEGKVVYGKPYTYGVKSSVPFSFIFERGNKLKTITTTTFDGETIDKTELVYTITKTSPSIIPNTMDVYLDFVSATKTFFTSEAVKDANLEKVLSYDNWEKGVSKDVTKDLIREDAKASEAEKEIFKDITINPEKFKEYLIINTLLFYLKSSN